MFTVKNIKLYNLPTSRIIGAGVFVWVQVAPVQVLTSFIGVVDAGFTG